MVLVAIHATKTAGSWESYLASSAIDTREVGERWRPKWPRGFDRRLLRILERFDAISLRFRRAPLALLGVGNPSGWARVMAMGLN